MSRARPGLRFVVPVVPGLRDAVEALRKQHAPDAAITLLDGQAHEALAACDVASSPAARRRSRQRSSSGRWSSST
jgi:lipid-A-disaccharide synthase